jgi:N6-L-threonylcarbamoyladenine synthase
MKVLAIETSCDETGIALVEGRHEGGRFEFIIHKAALLSQAQLHAPYGGVFPNLAKREHQKNLPALFAEFEGVKVDAIVATAGPGLEPALWTGITFAQELALRWQKPLYAANHMEAHLISSLARSEGEHYVLENVSMPVLALLISGGHTEFVHMRDWFQYHIVGETLDDAVGEAFDKVARMLALSYPGGPEISKLATHARANKLESAIKLPRPMINSGTCDVSFSGLKTAALYSLKDKQLTDDEKAAFAAEFEEAVGDVFVAKTRQALNATGAQTFVIGGGVAANRYIRERLEQLIGEEYPEVEFRLPHIAITGDNAIMIAEAALCHLLTGDWQEPPAEIKAEGQLSIASA